MTVIPVSPPRTSLLCATFLLLSVCAQAELPDTPGHAEVTAQCTACHGARNIERTLGYSDADWRELIDTMVLIPDRERLDRIVSYLTHHYPPATGHTANQVSGNDDVRFLQWRVPTRGQRARDPHEAPDGSIWWAGQWGNLVGRIDRKTGDMREYPLPPDAMPHTVTVAADGGVWYTGNRNASIGRLDPASGDIKVYAMPDPAARDPHTAIFDAKGQLWFTAQHANMAGRLVPDTGEVTLVTMPRPRVAALRHRHRQRWHAMDCV